MKVYCQSCGAYIGDGVSARLCGVCVKKPTATVIAPGPAFVVKALEEHEPGATEEFRNRLRLQGVLPALHK
mgnify:CR=1 FL=1